MIIATLTYRNTMFDLQIPTDIPLGDLLGWIIDYVNRLFNDQLKSDSVALVLDRKEEVIRTDMTLEESGVRNGDYITVLNMNI